MTPVDVLIAIFVLALAALGYERGLIRGAPPLIGFVAGAAIGGRLGPELLSDGSESAYAPVVTLGSGLLLGAALAVALEGVGSVIRRRARIEGAARALDGIGGAALMGALGLLVVWAVGAVALHSSGSGSVELRSAVQRSAILGALNEVLPPSGPLLNVLRRIDPTPTVAGPEAKVGPPDPKVAENPEVDAAGDSVVKVLGTACGLGVEGSGWVIAPELVATNAHVIAGEADTTVSPRPGSPELDAEAVHYQPRNDFALLEVPGLGLSALELVGDPQSGTAGAVLGYPENGPFTVVPARLGTTAEVVSQDSYGRGPVKRRMTSLRGGVRSGNSGGPMVDGEGRVLTTVFGSEQTKGRPAGGLGVPNEVASEALHGELEPTRTGPCAA
ncbi:MAG: MarP family serine protease [bacterium]